jgi:hypothetical protein
VGGAVVGVRWVGGWVGGPGGGGVGRVRRAAARTQGGPGARTHGPPGNAAQHGGGGLWEVHRAAARRPSSLLRGQASCTPANLSSASTVHLAGSLLGGGSECAGSGVDMSATDASPDSSRLRAACCGLLGCCATRWLALAGSWRSVAMARVVSGSGWRKCSFARALGPCGAAGEPSNALRSSWGGAVLLRCGGVLCRGAARRCVRWRGAGSSVAPPCPPLRFAMMSWCRQAARGRRLLWRASARAVIRLPARLQLGPATAQRADTPPAQQPSS